LPDGGVCVGRPVRTVQVNGSITALQHDHWSSQRHAPVRMRVSKAHQVSGHVDLRRDRHDRHGSHSCSQAVSEPLRRRHRPIPRSPTLTNTTRRPPKPRPIRRVGTLLSTSSDNGMAIEEISRLMGHSSSNVTETVYRHQFRPVITVGAEAIGKVSVSLMMSCSLSGRISARQAGRRPCVISTIAPAAPGRAGGHPGRCPGPCLHVRQPGWSGQFQQVGHCLTLR
jgi:hypothetical protein